MHSTVWQLQGDDYSADVKLAHSPIVLVYATL